MKINPFCSFIISTLFMMLASCLSASEILSGTEHSLYAKIMKKTPAPSDTADKAVKKANEKEPPETDEKKSRWIEETLDYGIQDERIKAINKITQIKNEDVKRKLARRLIGLMNEESDPDVLVKAVTALSEMKEKDSIPLLTEKIDNPVEEVRIAAVYGLKRLGAVQAKDKMIRKLKEQDLEKKSNFTEALLSALAEFKAGEIFPFVKDALAGDKTDRKVKEDMILFLGKARAKEATDILLKLYADEEEEATLRAYAVNSLANIGIVEAAPEIKRVIKSIESYEFKKKQKYHTLYLYSITALAKLGDADAVPKLIQALRSNNPEIRVKVIGLIKEFKDQRTIDILKYKMKNDQEPKVRAAAKKALEELGVEVKDEKK